MNHLGYFHHSLKNLVQNFDSAAVADHKGQILHLKNPHPFDPGTWGDAFKIATKYFSMNAGDVFVFNDPFSGGNDFSVFSFITCLQKQQDSKPGVFLGHRLMTPLQLKDVLHPSKNIFRVPMTPVALSGQPQDALLDAMSGSPLAPAGLKDLLMAEIQKTQNTLKYFEKFPKEFLNAKSIQNYLTKSREQALEVFHEKPWGETKVEIPLDSGECIKLHLEINENGVRADFSGTTFGKDFFLPPGALLGVCIYWMSRYAKILEPMNDGVFSIFQVSQPTQSCLAAKSPQPTAKGFKIGARVLATALDLALSKMDLRPPRGISNHFGMYLQIDFANRAPMELYLPNGLGALGDAEGSVGIDALNTNSFLNIENTENRWPVRIHRIDVRNTTHGKGKVNGGRGIIYKIELLEAAQIYWMSDLSHYRFPVQKFQTTPDKVEIIFDEEPHFSPFGQKEISAGKIITVGSGSGGGLI